MVLGVVSGGFGACLVFGCGFVFCALMLIDFV